MSSKVSEKVKNKQGLKRISNYVGKGAKELVKWESDAVKYGYVCMLVS